jgi:hypothetical protein
MGACTFTEYAQGRTAQEAFNKATEKARYEYGHRGYTGTIAEKDDFVMIDLPDGIKPESYANVLLDECDPRVDDKWGPAGCFDLGDGEYLFFGWASE